MADELARMNAIYCAATNAARALNMTTPEFIYAMGANLGKFVATAEAEDPSKTTDEYRHMARAGFLGGMKAWKDAA
jgi:hypothetical protein